MSLPRNQPRILAFLAFLILGAAPAQAQYAVVRVRSLEALRSDLHYLARQADRADLARLAEDFLQDWTGSKEFDGVDPRRPLGLYLLWPQKAQDFTNLDVPVVGFLPIADEKRFLGLLEKMGVKLQKEGDVFRLLKDKEGRGALRLAHGYAYLTNKPDALGGKLPEPTALVPTGAEESVVAASLLPEHLPKEYRDDLDSLFNPLGLFLSLSLGNDEKQPGETEEQHRQRVANNKRIRAFPAALKTGLIHFLDQTREITFRLVIDQKKQAVMADLTVWPRSPTRVEEFAAYVAEAHSRFAPQVRNAAMGAFVHFPPKGPTGDWLGGKEAVTDTVRDLADPTYRSSVLKGLRVLFETLAADGLDLGLFQNRPDDKEVPFVLGLKVRQGHVLDHLMRDLLKDLPTPTKAQISVDWNHGRHGAARIHRLQFKGNPQELLVSFREDVVFACFGKGGMKKIQEALDGFGRETPGTTPLVEFRAAPEWLLEAEPLAEYRKKEGADPAKDRLRVTWEGGKDLRLRLTLSASLLKWAVGLFE